jgi:HSP20 family protein
MRRRATGSTLSVVPGATRDEFRLKEGAMSSIVRWNPWRELESVEQRMRRLLDDFDIKPAALPAADMYETDTEVVVELEVPGFEEKEIDIELADHTLSVKGERKEETERTDRSFRVHERLERRFERRFELPTDADTEKVSASFEKGVLAIHAPKAATSARKIEIAK